MWLWYKHYISEYFFSSLLPTSILTVIPRFVCFDFSPSSIMAKSDLENQRSPEQQIGSAQEVQLGTIEKYGATRNIIAADLLDDRYAQTQRGLNNRRVQMM